MFWLDMAARNCAQKSAGGNAARFRRAVFWLAGCILLSASSLCCGQARPDVAPPASWVAPVSLDARAALAPLASPANLRWLLKDRQINAQNDETFNHEALQVLTPGGADAASRIFVNYDPSYQLLTFHWVRIVRGSNVQNALDPGKIAITLPGTNADKLLFNAEEAAVVPLDDVRPGDIIDYAYSVEGNNPVFAGSFSGEVELQSTYPITRSVTRLLWPVGRALFVQNHGSNIKYSTTRAGNTLEFGWDIHNVPGLIEEPYLPAGYVAFPWVQLSEFRTWAEVNRFVLGLFTDSSPPSPELARKIDEWKNLPDPGTQVVAALRFLQDEVRNVDIEAGATGYKPAGPSAVFDRRYGDSKDKSLLLAAILRALHIEAWPVLVSTKLMQSVWEMHPSAAVFDHALTVVNLDGQSYWLDATAGYQRGPLAARSWPLYGYGLVLRPGTTGLTAITPSPALPLTTMTAYFQLGRVGQASSLKIVTIAEGRDAETLRNAYANIPRDEIERRNLNYLAKFYPEIAASAPLVFTDNEQQNEIEVDEFYSIQRIWSQLPNLTTFQCQVYPVNVGIAAEPPIIAARVMPLGVPYPEHQIFRANITVPGTSFNRPEEEEVDDPAFYFHRSTSLHDGALFLEYEFRTLTGAVPVDGVQDYIQHLGAAGELMSYTIIAD
jgi:hypothetical protein